MGDSFFYTAIPSFTKLLLLCFIREKLNIKTNDSLSWNLNCPISEFVGETSYLVLTFLSPNVFFHELTIRYDMLCDPIIPWATITEYWISISYLRSVNWLWKKWKKMLFLLCAYLPEIYLVSSVYPSYNTCLLQNVI